MTWKDFLAGKISVYCGDRTGAEQFLNECDAHGISTASQRSNLQRYTRHFAYRYNGRNLVVCPCGESDWTCQLYIENVTKVLRYADIRSESIQLDTLDGLL